MNSQVASAVLEHKVTLKFHLKQNRNELHQIFSLVTRTEIVKLMYIQECINVENEQ